MTTIGSAPTPTIFQDRAFYARSVAASSEGRFTAEEVTAQLEESDRMWLQQAQNDEKYFAGEGIPVHGTTYEMYAKALVVDRAERSQHYTNHTGPVLIEAMNVNSAVSAQGQLTGGDLRNLSGYADYLRNEVSAAKQARPDVDFIGAWGKDRVTSDVNEYVGWLYEAAKLQQQPTSTTSATSSLAVEIPPESIT